MQKWLTSGYHCEEKMGSGIGRGMCRTERERDRLTVGWDRQMDKNKDRQWDRQWGGQQPWLHVPFVGLEQLQGYVTFVRMLS